MRRGPGKASLPAACGSLSERNMLKPDQSQNQPAGLPAKHPNLPGDVGSDMDNVEDAARFARDMLVLAELDDEDDDDDCDYDYDAPFTPHGYDHRLGFLPQTVSWGVDPVLDLGIPAALIDTYAVVSRISGSDFGQFVSGSRCLRHFFNFFQSPQEFRKPRAVAPEETPQIKDRGMSFPSIPFGS